MPQFTVSAPFLPYLNAECMLFLPKGSSAYILTSVQPINTYSLRDRRKAAVSRQGGSFPPSPPQGKGGPTHATDKLAPPLKRRKTAQPKQKRKKRRIKLFPSLKTVPAWCFSGSSSYRRKKYIWLNTEHIFGARRNYTACKKRFR